MNNSYWPVVQAKLIISKLAEHQNTVVFQTGYGPSGLPHIGTFSEVARTNFVIMALKQLRPDLNTKLIAFCDDRDGLRKLPPNIPNHQLLKEHLGKPLSSIPDPFGKDKSYSAYMNNQLCQFLDDFGFNYECYSATEVYLQGTMDKALLRVADNYQAVRNAFIKTIRQEKQAQWSPFLPICENCGRVYSTIVTNVDLDSYSLDYSCELSAAGYSACGYKSKIPINGKNVKLGWKVDWACRWFALNVDYEMHGEDLLDSARLSKKICQIIGGKPPITFKYELFLDEHRNKISKTKGNGVSIEQWLSYSPLNALLYFTLGQPDRVLKMGLSIIPQLVDDYLTAEKSNPRIDFNHPLWYIRKFNSYNAANYRDFLSYQLLNNILSSIGEYDLELLLDYATRYKSDLIGNTDFSDFCKKVISYHKDLQKLIANGAKNAVVPDQKYAPQLATWLNYLGSLNQEAIDGNSAQKAIFKIAKENQIPMKEWFKFLYNVYFATNQGPKLGQYFAILGRTKAIAATEKASLRLSAAPPNSN